MLSFASMIEQMKKTPLMTSGDDSRALTALKSGKDLHDDDETSFWDEFMTLCSNRDGMAELLNVSADKVSSWPARISDYLDKLEQKHADTPEKDEKEVLPTGHNGAITNQDPFLGSL